MSPKYVTKYVKPEKLEPIPVVLPPATIDTPSEEENIIAVERKRLLDELREELEPEFFKKFILLNYYITKVGLVFPEACRVVNLNPVDVSAKAKKNPTLQRLLDVAELQYKTSLIKTISIKAIDGKDDKHALWLLERRFPDEFNQKKGSGSNDSDKSDLLALAFEFVQKTGDKDSLVKETSGRAFLFKKNSNEDILKSLGKLTDGQATSTPGLNTILT